MIPWVHVATHYLILAVLYGSAVYVVINLINGQKWKDRRVSIGAGVFCAGVVAYVLFLVLA